MKKEESCKCPIPRPSTASARSAKRPAASSSRPRRAASSPSAATRTTRSPGATSARSPTALKELQEDPDRVRRPLRRTQSGWQEIGWDEAFAEAAKNLIRDPRAARRGRDRHVRRKSARPRPRVPVHAGAVSRARHEERVQRFGDRHAAEGGDDRPHVRRPVPGGRAVRTSTARTTC